MARKRRPASAITVSRWFSSARRSRSIRLSRNSTSARDTSPISSPRRGSRSGASRSPPVSAWTALTTEVSGRTTAKRVMTKPISATARAMTAPLISARLPMSADRRVDLVEIGLGRDHPAGVEKIERQGGDENVGGGAVLVLLLADREPGGAVKGGLDGVDVDPLLEERRAAVEPRSAAKQQILADDQRLAGEAEAGRDLHDPVDAVDGHAKGEHADRMPALAENRHGDKAGRLPAGRLVGREVDEDLLAALRVGDGLPKRGVEAALLGLQQLAGEVVLLLGRVDDVPVEIDEKHVAITVAIGEIAEARVEAGVRCAVARTVAGVVEPAPRLVRVRVVGDIEPMKFLRGVGTEIRTRIGETGDRLDDEGVGCLLREGRAGSRTGSRRSRWRAPGGGQGACPRWPGGVRATPGYSRRPPRPGRRPLRPQ